jgi:hypothetical protein
LGVRGYFEDFLTPHKVDQDFGVVSDIIYKCNKHIIESFERLENDLAHGEKKIRNAENPGSDTSESIAYHRSILIITPVDSGGIARVKQAMGESAFQDAQNKQGDDL